VGLWGGGWLISYSGITYDLDPYNEYWLNDHRQKKYYAWVLAYNGTQVDTSKIN